MLPAVLQVHLPVAVLEVCVHLLSQNFEAELLKDPAMYTKELSAFDIDSL